MGKEKTIMRLGIELSQGCFLIGSERFSVERNFKLEIESIN